ncbi:MAG TPA: 4a-hydroxytetrahydrobiopterin dehydratase [Mariprofundaceae bacterium]|nr:4a-hydroxytetrahydrobiopterin dehydratase [Mariprofundaceae bacterium]
MSSIENPLQDKSCIPCQGGVPPLNADEAAAMMEQIKGWDLIESATKIRRTFTFKNFMQAQNFAVKVGNLAESENHHPDITYGWGFCTVLLYTHKINGLHENDFIVAAKVNGL